MSNEVYDRLMPGAFAKNIPYLDDSMRKELFRKGVKWCQAYLIQLAKVAGSDAETEYESVIMRECQAKYGAQLFIDKKLSDEMMDVDLRDITREDIVFPFNSMEFYFEDPQIPTFIFQKHSEEEARRDWNIAYAGLGGTAVGDGFRMCFFGGPYTFTNIYPMEAIREFLEYRDIFRKDGRNCLDDSDFEKRLRRFLFLMAVKILLYISIPKYKAVPVTRNQIPHGKPGVKNRPNRPIFRAIYVPSEVDTIKHHITGTGPAMPPHRRRGHFRILRDERFRNKRGETIFVKPCLIHGGSVGDQLYIARKAS